MTEENKLRVALLTNSLQAWEIEPLKFAERVNPPHWMTKLEMGDSDLGDTSCCDLAILGCGRAQERFAINSGYSGLIAARYSIYYGQRSPYTGNFLNETYSFDIPKERSIVNKFLNNENLISAILDKDAKNVKKSLEEVNADERRPIIVSPLLEIVLKMRSKKI